jgi:hypothetical protein
MTDEEIKKILLELREKRKSNRSTTLTSVIPTGSVDLVSRAMDFASLYPSSMTMKFGHSKQNIRKKKIKNIFSL